MFYLFPPFKVALRGDWTTRTMHHGSKAFLLVILSCCRLANISRIEDYPLDFTKFPNPKLIFHFYLLKINFKIHASITLCQQKASA